MPRLPLKMRGVPPAMAGVALVFVLSSCHCGQSTEGSPSAESAKTDSPGGLSEEIQQPPSTTLYRGMQSCAQAGCHGSLTSAEYGITQSEVNFWREHDPHAKAHLTLADPLSVDIIRRLAKAGGEGEANIRHIYEWCFRCHSSTSLNPPTAIASREELTRYEGVGCEACHGPAANWLTSHWQSDPDEGAKATWLDLVDHEFSTLSRQVNTKDLPTRAAACTRCHVGQSAGDVNHDLIAAGHPVLKFELSVYHRDWPRHWTRSDHPDRKNAALDWDLWSAGQKLSMIRALNLLASRADRGDRHHPERAWPEFSEYDCAACHHHLCRNHEFSKSRSDRKSASRPSITPAWASWPFALVTPAAQTEVSEALAPLRQTMESQIIPEKCEVVDQAEAVCRLFVDQPPPIWQTMLPAFGEPNALADLASWDRHAQMYFALLAWEMSLGVDRPGHAIRLRKLQSFRHRLALKPLYNSQRNLPNERGCNTPERLRPIQRDFSDFIRNLDLMKDRD